MLLQHLLLRDKRNYRLRRREFSDHWSIRQRGRGHGRLPAASICQDALPLRSYPRRRSNHLGLTHLTGIDANRRLPNRLSRGERILRNCHRGTAIHITDIGDVYVGDIDVRDPRVGDIDLADITLRHMIRRIIRLAGAEGKPSDEARTTRDTHAESATTNEGDERGSIVGTRPNRAGVPSPTIVGICPAAIMERSEAPGFIV